MALTPTSGSVDYCYCLQLPPLLMMIDVADGMTDDGVGCGMPWDDGMMHVVACCCMFYHENLDEVTLRKALHVYIGGITVW